MKYWNYYLNFCFFCSFPSTLFSQTPRAIDFNFGAFGTVEIKDSLNEYVEGKAVLMPDGKIVVMSFLYKGVGENGQLVLTRLLPNGRFDYSFGLKGQIRPNLTVNFGRFGGVNCIIATNDNKIVITGYTSDAVLGAAFVARFNPTGELDETFGQAGLVIFDIGSYLDKFLSVLVKPDGKILLGGFFSNPVYKGLLLVQLQSDGTLDSDFADGGVNKSNPTLFFRTISSVTLQEDGKIVTCGDADADGIDIEIFRFNPDGGIDSTFASDGHLKMGDIENSDIAYASAVQLDQKLVFCGASFCDYTSDDGIVDFDDEIVVFRLNSDGSVDNTFGTEGKILTDFGLRDRFSTMVVQPDMKILVGTDSWTGGKLNFWMARYESDGSIDNTFGDGGMIKTPDYSGSSGTGNILLDANGKIIYIFTADSKVILQRYFNDNLLETHERKMDFESEFHFRPNPVSDYTLITWTMAKPSEVQVDLFDLNGHLIQQLIAPAYYSAGSHEQEVYFNNNHHKGVYYLAVTIGRERRFHKLIKI